MSTIFEEFLLPAQEYIVYDFNTEGETRLSLSVRALDYINVFVVDATNYRKYEKDMTFDHYGSENVTQMIRPIWIPRAGHWHIIVENPNDNDVVVEFKMRI